MKTLFALALLSLSFAAFSEDALIPYKIIKKEATLDIKVVFEVEVPLVHKRLPNADELGKISTHLVSKEPKRERAFVFFYLPRMKRDAGAFATAHHNPEMKVEILPQMLFQLKVFSKPFDELTKKHAQNIKTICQTKITIKRPLKT